MLLSRVADALYWISRYLERAEHTARVVGVRLDLGLERKSEFAADDATSLIATSILDSSNAGSVAACVTAARENARQVREEISTEMWEQLNGLFLRLKQVRTESSWRSRPHYLTRLVIEGVHLVEGTTGATMGHGEGWHYLQVGRFLERAEATAALLGLHFSDLPTAADEVERRSRQTDWVGLLRSCSALEGYCRHYTADIRAERIAEFLLLNSEFPRSVRFAAARVESSLRALSRQTMRSAGGRAERLAGRLHASLDYGQVDEILSEDPHTYLEGVGRYCADIHAAIYQTYLTYPIEAALPA